MSRLIARILLTIFMLPAAALVYILAFVFSVQLHVSQISAFLVGGFFGFGFIAVYWLLLWKNSIIWNARRISLTWVGALVALVLGTILGALAELFARFSNGTFGTFVATMAAPIAWLIFTVFAWRETSVERGQRIGTVNRSAIVCPTCGYNLTGLTATRCPECGSQFTLDELFASQSKDSDLNS